MKDSVTKGTLIDHFRAFHAFSKANDFSMAARSVYFALLGEFNANFWIEELSISDRAMMELSGAKSTATVHDARNILKSAGFIDFRKGKNRKAIYRLLPNHLTSTEQTAGEHLTNAERTVETNSNIHAREDALEVDVKTIISQSERMSASAFNWNVEAEEKLTALWLENCGAGVTFELLSYFRFIVEKHGVAFCEELIREMAGGLKGDRMTLNYLRGAYNFKLKGGKKSGESKQRPALTVVPRIKPVAQSVSDEEGDDAYRELLARSASRNESYNPADDIPVDLKAIMGGR